MKVLLPFLVLISVSAQARDPMSCADLGRYISGNFRALQNATIPSNECGSFRLPTLVEGLSEEEANDLLRGETCKPVGAIETQLNQLESEIAILIGFEKMKTDIASNIEATRTDNKTKAQRAAAAFRSALSTARVLEGILDTTGETPLIRELKNIPIEQRNSATKLRTALVNLCRNRTAAPTEGSEGLDRNNICSPGFNFRDAEVGELNTLIESSELTPQQIEDWKNALAISKRNNSGPYNFRTMYNDVYASVGKVEGGALGLNRTELTAIRNLPDFQSQNALPILNQLMSKREDMRTHIRMDETRVLGQELKARQEQETKSKMSWLLRETQSALNLDEAEATTCNQATTDIAKAKLCWEIMDRKQQSIPTNNTAHSLIDKMRTGMASSFTYLDSLSDLGQCLDDGEAQENSVLTRANQGYAFDAEKCRSFHITPENLDRKIKQAKALKALKMNILGRQNNMGRMTDFALSKFRERCGQNVSVISTPLECEDERITIAREAQTLTSGLLETMITVQNPGTPQDIADLCESTEQTQRICDFYNPEPANPNAAPTNQPVDTAESPYIEPRNQRNLQREAVVDGLTGIGAGVLQQLMQRPQMYNPYQQFNPYPVNPYMYRSMYQTDSILFQARYFQGYGTYFPSGATPYTAFPLISPYVQAAYSPAGNTSAYFTNFGTYQ